MLALLRRLPLYHRLLVTSDHFSFVLERYLYKAVKKHKTVLDVGCREGTNLLYCGSSNNACVGIDIDLKSAHFAHQMSAPNAFGVLASGTQLPFADGSFDLVICCDVIEHIEEYEVLVKEMARVAQTQGELVLSTPDGDVRPKPAPFHVKHFRSTELVDMIEPTFSQLRLRSIVRNCQAKEPFWAFRDRYPKSPWQSIPLNAWTNLRYYLQGYARSGGFRRKDVTDSTFILTAIKKPTA
jgi:2-polyprenyl-3-methyl-5-hydroxy-6-metoxy-1,4-benzoquinol methylase